MQGKFRRVAVFTTLTWISFFVIIPHLFVIAVSFMTRDPENMFRLSFTLENYRELFSPVFMKVSLYSLRYAFATTLITLLAGYPFAFILARLPERVRGYLIILMIIPFWTSSLIRTYSLIILFKANGILNSLLLKLGLIAEPLQILYTEGAVLVGLVYALLPFMIMPLFSSVTKLDYRLIEAARDLGATSRHCFFRIILPMTMPGIIAGCTMVFLPTLGLFYIPDLLGGGQNMLLGNFIKNQFLTTGNWPVGSAASVVLTLIMGLLLWAYYLSTQKTKDRAVEQVL